MAYVKGILSGFAAIVSRRWCRVSGGCFGV